MSNWSIAEKERTYLRELAKKQLEYSRLPIMQEREKLWYKHNDLKGEIPMIHFETWTCEQDLLPPLNCESEAGRNIELHILREILNHEAIGDDRVVSSFYMMSWWTGMRLFDLKIETEHSKDSEGRDLGYQFRHPITSLQQDVQLLKPSSYWVDREGTLQWKAFVEEIIGDILPVKMGMGSLSCSPTQHVVRLMGMEDMMYAMVDCPEEFHLLMKRISGDHIEFMKWMEKEGLLFLNNGNDPLAQGSWGFSSDLPGMDFNTEKGITTNNLWGYMDSQETVGVSPEMFGEFFFPYFHEVTKHYGLLSYGCCEPVHAYWEKYISKLPGLRKVSISPWCDEEYMGQALKGTNVIYHRKPSPNFTGVGTDLEEDAFRAHIRKTFQCTQGCKLEFSFRDVYVLNGRPDKPRRAVQIVRELIESY